MQLARILDKDGYSNVREGQGNAFKVVGIVRVGELFYCQPTTSDWWKVQGTRPLEGYLHKSRIQLIEQLDDSQQKALLQQVFSRQKRLATVFQQTRQEKSGKDAYQKARQELETHGDAYYEPMLWLFPRYFCRTTDKETLVLLFETIGSDQGSASEAPAFALGKSYSCQSELLLQQLSQQSGKQLESILSDLEWGVRNEFDVADDGTSADKRYLDYKQKLEKIKK